MSNLEMRIEPALERPPGRLPDELGFGRIFTGRIFMQRYTLARGWHDAVIGPYYGGQPGPIAQRLYQLLIHIQSRCARDPYGWTRVVSLRETAAVG